MLPTAAFAKTIYLDHAATTPTDPAVLAVMAEYYSAAYSNPSSLHSSGRKARQVVNEARAKMAGVLNAKPEEIIFTGSGTEADNLAIVGVARANKKNGNHIIISAVEHKAVLEAAYLLEQEGFEISIVPVDEFGMIDVAACTALIRTTTILISVMYANNEVGTIEPIKELVETVKKHRNAQGFPLVHTDACQAAGALSLDVEELGVDLMTINSGKIYGPKGIGALYKKQEVEIAPLIVGGEQEGQLRAGTESLPLIAGFAHALILVENKRTEESLRLTTLRDYFIDRLKNEIENVVLNGHETKRLPNNVHISLPFIEGESLLLLLDYYGIEVGTGSACSASDLRPSHVMAALGKSLELMHGSLRFSLGQDTKKADIDMVMEVLPAIVKHLSNLSALTTNVINKKV